MNEEKNNIGVNNSGLPPMNTVPTGSMPSQNMSVNNLPPMGSMPSAPVQPNNNTVNIQDKYGLPPISNFTNFNTSYETPKVDNNTSVFDLMDQFDSVNNQNLVSNSNEQPEQISSSQNVSNNQSMPTVNSLQPEINSVSNNSIGGVVNNNLGVFTNQVPSNNVMNTVPSIQGNVGMVNNVNTTNDVNSTELFNMFSGNNGIVSETPKEPSTPVEVNNQTTNNTDNMNVNPLNIFGGNVGVNETPVNNVGVSNQAVTPNINTPVLNNTNIPVSNNEVNSINRDTLDVNQSNNVGVNQVNTNGFVTNTPDVINNPSIQDLNSVPVNNNVESVTNTPVVNQGQPQQENAALNVPNNQVDENQISSVVEIPTTSLDSINIDTNVNPVNNLNTVTNDNSSVNTVEKPKKKKKSKLLFIILLIVTILILSAVGVLSYFMFFKTDKLVCGFQDYSNEQYILDESMVFRFKGNKMTDAKLSQVLTFTEDNLDKKDSYLEELKNQYQGLGFNVSFVENEDGFEIDMDFTKTELESWYGTNLKNSSKTQMKKEMRDSGYTCK